MKLVGITGGAGSGKSTAASYLVAQGWVEIGLADEMKRICARLFNWPPEVLWGPSERREERMPLGQGDSPGEPKTLLTPRRALQTLGTEWGRACYEDVWIDEVLRVAEHLRSKLNPWRYDPQKGLSMQYDYSAPGRLYSGVVIPDVRFDNEALAIKKAGGKIWRIVRDTGRVDSHASEKGISPALVDVTIHNDKELDELKYTVQRLGEEP